MSAKYKKRVKYRHYNNENSDIYHSVSFPPALHLGLIVSNIHLHPDENIDGIHGPILDYRPFKQNKTQV